MKHYDITDEKFLKDVRTGENLSLDIICPKGFHIARDAQGLLTKQAAQILADAINVKKEITYVDLLVKKQEQAALGVVLSSLSGCPLQSLYIQVIGPDTKSIVSDYRDSHFSV